MLGDEHLMSSLFTVAEIALGTLGLAALDGRRPRRGRRRPRPRLHSPSSARRSAGAVAARRRGARRGDRLARRRAAPPRPPRSPPTRAATSIRATSSRSSPRARRSVTVRRARATPCCVDIDHTPRHLLHPSHAPFYEVAGLRRLADRLHPGGVFALWSDDPPDGELIAVVDEAIGTCEAHVVPFPNPHTGGTAHQHRLRRVHRPLAPPPASVAPCKHKVGNRR